MGSPRSASRRQGAVDDARRGLYRLEILTLHGLVTVAPTSSSGASLASPTRSLDNGTPTSYDVRYGPCSHPTRPNRCSISVRRFEAQIFSCVVEPNAHRGELVLCIRRGSGVISLYAVLDNAEDETQLSTGDEISHIISRHGSNDRIRRREVGGGGVIFATAGSRNRGYIPIVGVTVAFSQYPDFGDVARDDTAGRDLVVDAIALGEDDAGRCRILDVGCVCCR